MKKYKKYIYIILLLLISYGVYTVFFKTTDNIVQYTTEKAFVGDLVKRVNATGQIRPRNLIDVGAQVSGQIEKINVTLGDAVKSGDLLVHIDSTTQQNDLEVKKSQLESYKAELFAEESSLRKVTLQYERESRLRTGKATSEEAYELAQNELALGKANVAKVEALIRQAQLAVDNAETDLGYTFVSAPKDGVVVSVVVEEGQTVNASQVTPTLLQIADLSSMEIKLEISEGDITKVQAGMPVEFTILSEPNKKYNTTLADIDPAYTIMSNGTYTKSNTGSSEAIYYYANAIIENQDELLRIGMTVQSSITIAERKDALLVPNLAIKRGPHGSFVSVLENGEVKNYPIQEGLTNGIYTEVLPAERIRPERTRPDGTRPDGARPDGTRPDGTRPDSDRPEHPRTDESTEFAAVTNDTQADTNTENQENTIIEEQTESRPPRPEIPVLKEGAEIIISQISSQEISNARANARGPGGPGGGSGGGGPR